jgi:hypothetical protein
VAERFGISPGTVQRISRPFEVAAHVTEAAHSEPAQVNERGQGRHAADDRGTGVLPCAHLLKRSIEICSRGRQSPRRAHAKQLY